MYAKFDIDDLIISSFRYYLGRRTASVSGFCHSLVQSWDESPENVQECIQRDLEREFERDDKCRELKHEVLPLGMDCDRQDWEKVRKNVLLI